MTEVQRKRERVDVGNERWEECTSPLAGDFTPVYES